MSQYLDPCQGTHLRWVVEGQVLLLDIQTDSGQETHLYDRMIMDQFNLATNSIDLIVKMPSFQNHDSASVKQWTNCPCQQHPRLGHIIIVGAKTPSISSRGAKLRNFETLEEALSFLHA